MPLSSAASQYRRQQKLTATAVRAARRARSSREVGNVINTFQLAAATMGADSVGPMLAEQGITNAPVARVNPLAFTSGGLAGDLAASVATDAALDRLVSSLVLDAARGAAGVGMAVRPEVTAHIRYLNPPSCSRCAILAGRIYRWSQGFQRHPLCDCVMVPTTDAKAPGLISDPEEAFRKGLITDLSKADTRAINDGADMGKVVNVRRYKANLRSGTTVLRREPNRLTPAAIYRLAGDDREKAIALLARAGYITDPTTLTRIADAEKAKRAALTVSSTPLVDMRKDLARVNPEWQGAEPGYTMNCTRCVSAYEMRRRGFDVEAKPLVNAYETAEVFMRRFRTADGIAPTITLTPTTAELAEFSKDWPEAARGFLFVSWAAGQSHVLSVEKLGGVVRYIDPQSNKVYDLDELLSRVKTAVTGDKFVWSVRTDNLTLPEPDELVRPAGTATREGAAGVERRADELRARMAKREAEFDRQERAARRRAARKASG